MSAENKLRAAIAQSYADFRTEQAERVGLSREMAPSVGPVCGCDLPGLACPIHGAP